MKIYHLILFAYLNLLNTTKRTKKTASKNINICGNCERSKFANFGGNLKKNNYFHTVCDVTGAKCSKIELLCHISIM